MNQGEIWRRTMSGISVYVFIFLLFASATAGPIKKRKSGIRTCSRHCRVPKASKLKYVSNQVYDYSYKVEIDTHLSHTPQHSTKLLVEALAQVHVISTCEMVLKLREVSIRESDPIPGNPLRKSDNSRHFRQELEKEALRFAFLDGLISDVCPSEDETVWALNVKRGFLSAFQNSMDKLDTDQTVIERDVLGECRTVYQASGSGWFSSTVTKSRDLNNCTVTAGQRSDSKLLTSLLTGRQDCEQTMDWNGILISSTCLEQRHFRPVEGESTGAVTTVSQSIKFLQKRDRGKYSPPIHKRMPLEFDPTSLQQHTDTGSDEPLRTVRAVLRQMCELTEIRPETTDLFFALVANVRRLTGPSLRVLYERVSGASLCSDPLRVKKYFLDALAMAGTDTTIRQLTKALTARNAQPVNTQVLLNILAFLPNTSANMLQAARTLLDHAPLSEAAMLPVSSMVHNYCQHNYDCDTRADVSRILLHFRRVVGVQCYAKGPNARKAELGVRAIGNAGQSKGLTEVLNNCMRRRNNPLVVRVTAAEAFRRMDCRATRERPQLIFEDTTEPTELRIASYLTTMQCAKTSDIRRLQRLLAAEVNTQVLSFVFTHLTSLRETNADLKQDIDELFKNVDFASKDLGRLQMSRHFAGQLVSDRLKFLADLIWPSYSSSSGSPSSSSASWFPRSFTTNWTVNFMGEETGLVEVGVRGEGLEFLVEDVFLPLLGRKRRPMGPRRRQEKLDSLKGSIFARILGNEVAFGHFTGTGSFMKGLTSGKFFNAKEIMSYLSTEGKTFLSQNLVLLDQRVTVATSCGLPLSVSVNSTAAAQLHVAGKLDLRRALNRPRVVQIDGEIKPSVALRVTGTMSMDAVVTRSALRMTGTLYSSTIVKGRVQMDRGRLYNLELDVPRDKMTILDARSEVSFIYNNKEHTLSLGPTGQRNFSLCTGRTGIQLVGLDLCGEIHLPVSTSRGSVYEFLSKPSSASITLYKRDSLLQYKLFAEHVKTKHSLHSEISFSTPGSAVDRMFELYMNANMKQKKIELRMASPWKKAELTSAITSTAKITGARCVLTIDNNVTYGVISEVKVIKGKMGVTYRPLLELRPPRVKPMTLTGSATIGRYWKKLSFDVSLRGVSKMSPILKGSLTNSGKELSVRGSFSLDGKNTYSFACGTFVRVSGKLALKTEVNPFLYVNTPFRQLIAFTGRGDYRKGRSLRADVKLLTEWSKPVSVQYAMVKTVTKAHVHYRLDAKLRSSVATVSVDARADIKGRHMLLTRLTLNHDIPTLLSKDAISVVTKLAQRSEYHYWNGIVQSKLESKANADYNFDIRLNAELQPTTSRAKLHFGRGADHVVNRNYVYVTSKMRHDVKNIYNVILAVVATAEIPSENINMELKASHSHSPRILESRMSVNYGDNQQTQARMTVINKSAKYLKIVGKALLYLPEPRRRAFRKKGKRKSGKKSPYFHLNVKVVESEDEYDIKTGAHVGKKKRDFSSTLNIKKPVSLRRVQMYSKGIPYSRAYQEFEAEFSHSMHPLLADLIEALVTQEWSQLDFQRPARLLASVSGATLLKEDMKRTKLMAKPDAAAAGSSEYSAEKVQRLFSAYEDLWMLSNDGVESEDIKDVKGGVDVKSSFIDLISGSLNFAHSYDGSLRETDVALNDNGDEYKCEVTIKDNFFEWLHHSTGEVIVTTPKKKLITEWQHELEDSQLRSTFLTSWAESRRIYFDLTGLLETTSQRDEFFADVILQSPWKLIRDWRVSVGHDAAPGTFHSKSAILRDGVRKMSHQITAQHTPAFTDASLIIFTPWTKKLSGSLLCRHDLYTVTGTAELAWNPRQKITAKGSASLEAWDDAEASLSVKTSLPGAKLIAAEMSNKMYGENLVSEVTVKYGASNTLSVETVVRRHDWRKVRVQVLTPFEPIRVLETGFLVDGSLRNMSSTADFRIFPTVKKYEASLGWVYDEDFSGKFHLDTPLKDFPYVQIVATSETKGKYRRSTVTLKHHPSQVYVLDSKYTLRSPGELKITLKTPYKSYSRFDIEIHQERTDTLSEVSVNVSFPPDQHLVAVSRVQFEVDADVRGTISLETSFAGWENCIASVDFSNDGLDFVTEGNVTVGDRTAVMRTVLLHAGRTDTNNQRILAPTSGMERWVVVTEWLKSLQTVETEFHTATRSLQKSNYRIDESLEGNKDFAILLSHDRSTKSSTTVFRLSSGSVVDLHLFSNHTRSLEDLFATLSVARGKDVLLIGNATLSVRKFGHFSEAGGSLTPEQIRKGLGVSGSNTTAETAVGDFNNTVINLETKVLSNLYRRLGFHTKVQTNFNADALDKNIHDLTDDQSLPVPSQTVSVHGWTESSRGHLHGVSLDASHLAQVHVHETQVHFRTTTNDTDDFTFLFRSSGVMSNFTGSALVNLRETQLVTTAVQHQHGAGLFRSSLSLQSIHTGNVSLAAEYLRNLENLTTNVSVEVENKLIVRCLYAGSKNNLGIGKIASEFRMDSRETGTVETSARVVFNTSKLNNLSAAVDARIQEVFGKVNLTLSEHGRVDFSGQVSRGEKKRMDAVTAIPKIQFTHRGTPSDFKTSVFVRHLHADPIDSVLEVRYNSLFDMKTKVVFKSPLHFARDLSLMMQNSGNGRGGNRALMSVGWAPYRKISLDANHNHLPNVVGVTRQVDVVIVTPFHGFQTGLVKARHSRILAQTDSSLEARVNDRTLLDLSLSSNDPYSLGLRQPLLGLFQRSAKGFSSKEKSHRGNFFVRWDLKNPNSNVRVVTKLWTNEDDGLASVSREFSVRVIQPWRVLAVKQLSRKTSKSMSGDGELLWDENDKSNKKIYYHYNIVDESSFQTSCYQGHFKLGTPLRAVEVNGSLVTDVRTAGLQTESGGQQLAQKAKGAFFWDADRDRKKRVTLTSVMTKGERRSAEFQLTIPALSQGIRLKSDLLAFTNTTVWNCTTSFSYSGDPQKTLTFATTLINTTAFRDGSDYTMVTSLTQPFSDLDLGFTSGVGGNESKYAGWLEGWFLTSQQLMRRAALKGVLHRLERSLLFTMTTPWREVSLEAAVPTGELQQLFVRGFSKDVRNSLNERQLGLHLLLDLFHRSFLIKINNDLDVPGNVLALEAWYVNDTAIRAEVYRNHVTGSVTDGVFAMRLNTSTMLHTRLSWRPEIPEQLQLFSRNVLARLNSYELHTKQALRHASKILRDELVFKYTSVVSSMANDVTPFMDLLERETTLVDRQLKSVLRGLKELYRANGAFLESLGEEFEQSAAFLRNHTRVLLSSYKTTIGSVRTMSDKAVNSVLLYHYDRLINHLTHRIVMAQVHGSERLEEILSFIDLYLLMTKDRIAEISNIISLFRNSDSYLDMAKHQLGSLRLPKGLQAVRAQVKAWLSPLSDTSPLMALASTANEMYEQGTWMNGYLHLASHTRDHLESIVDSLTDILMAEMRFRLRHFRFLHRSRFTVWLPHRGELQAEVCLPFPVHSLAATPDLHRIWADTVNSNFSARRESPSTKGRLGHR